MPINHKEVKRQTSESINFQAITEQYKINRPGGFQHFNQLIFYYRRMSEENSRNLFFNDIELSPNNHQSVDCGISL
jgi:hypothetical protein